MLLHLGTLLFALAACCTPALAQQPPKGKVPSEVTITNARAADLMQVTLTSGEKIARLAKPLAPTRKASIKLPRGSGCTVHIWGGFSDQSSAELELDVCQDSTVRFVD